jgi:hypothetical protein
MFPASVPTYHHCALDAFIRVIRDVLIMGDKFSGGTFLYVATAHILPEVSQNEVRKAGQDDDDHSAHAHGHGQLSWVEVGYLVAGVLLPLIMNIGHSH